MAAYLIVDLKVKDTEKLKEYGSQTPAILAEHNGTVFAKGAIERLHGSDSFETKVIFEFPERQNALDWYNSDAYQALIAVRDQAIDSSFHLIQA